MRAAFGLLVLLGLVYVSLAVNSDDPPQLSFQPPNQFPTPSPIHSRLIKKPLVLPRNGPLCYVQRVEAKPAADAAASFLEVSEGSESADAGSSGGGGAGGVDGVLHHVCHYTGNDTILAKEGGAKGQLVRPENLDFRRVNLHFFSDIDPRADYGVLGTPGGDAGEFLNALQTMETLTGTKYDAEGVSSAFQEYLRTMISRGKQYFYMNTDEDAQKALATAANVANPTKPKNAYEQNRLLAEAIKPEHVGSLHLKGILQNPDSYHVRKELVEWFIQTYLGVYFDGENALRQHLLFVVLKGASEKATMAVRVWSPDDCPGIAPLIVPNTGVSKACVIHEGHVKFFRQDLARWFSWKNADVDVKRVYAGLNALAEKQKATLSAYFDGTITDVIFSSFWDRWPF